MKISLTLTKKNVSKITPPKTWHDHALLSVRREAVGDFGSARVHAANARRELGVSQNYQNL